MKRKSPAPTSDWRSVFSDFIENTAQCAFPSASFPQKRRRGRRLEPTHLYFTPEVIIRQTQHHLLTHRLYSISKTRFRKECSHQSRISPAPIWYFRDSTPDSHDERSEKVFLQINLDRKNLVESPQTRYTTVKKTPARL